MRIATDGALHPGLDRCHILKHISPIVALLIVAAGPARGQDAPPPEILAKTVLTDVQFRGRKNVGLAEIEARTGLKKGAEVDVFLAEQGVQEIAKLYRDKGYPEAQVKLVEGNNSGDTRVILEIIEGSKGSIIGPAAPQGLVGGPPRPLILPKPDVFANDKALLMPKTVPGVLLLTEGGSTRIDPPAVPSVMLSPDISEAMAHLAIARDAQAAGDWRKALAVATLAIRASPGLAEAYQFRGEVYGSRKLNRRAISDLTEAIRLSPELSTLLWRGFYHCQDRDFKRSMADFDRSINMATDDVARSVAHRWRGAALVHRGDYQRAIADFNRAIGLSPGDSNDHRFRGYALAESGEHDRAIADFVRSNEIKPDPGNWYYGGESHYRQEKFALAQADYEKVLESEPENAHCLQGRGLALLAQGRVDESLADLNRAITRDPRFARAYIARGWARLAKRDLAGAVADFDKATGLQRAGIIVGWVDVGTNLAGTPKYDRAIAEFQDLCRQRPNIPWALIALFGEEARSETLQDPYFAIYFLRRLRPEAGTAPILIVHAYSDWRRIPDAPAAYAGRAVAALRQADWKEARDDLEAALEALLELSHPGSMRPPTSGLFDWF